MGRCGIFSISSGAFNFQGVVCVDAFSGVWIIGRTSGSVCSRGAYQRRLSVLVVFLFLIRVSIVPLKTASSIVVLYAWRICSLLRSQKLVI